MINLYKPYDTECSIIARSLVRYGTVHDRRLQKKFFSDLTTFRKLDIGGQLALLRPQEGSRDGPLLKWHDKEVGQPPDQCCGSVTFWCGSGGSADPCLWLMDPDSDPDPDPSIFIIDLQDAKFSCITFVPRRLFFAAQQRIAIIWSPKYYKKCAVS